MVEVVAGPTPVGAGYRLPEGLRWNAGHLWFSDMDGGVVHCVEGVEVRDVCHVPGQPSGLGWDPDGNLLVVSQLDAMLLRLVGERLEPVADLSAALRAQGGDVRPNDMYVDPAGTAYIGSVSFHEVGGQLVAEDSHPTPVVSVTADGEVATVTDTLRCPNGIVEDESGTGLVVAETRRHRLVTLSRIGEVVARTPCTAAPDGICADGSGAVWVALPFAGRVQRLDRDGTVLAELRMPGRVPLDCVLSDEEGDSRLYVASVKKIDHLGESRTGRVDRFSLPPNARPMTEKQSDGGQT